MKDKPALPQAIEKAIDTEIVPSETVVPAAAYAVTTARPPSEVLREAQKAAVALDEVLRGKRRKVMFNNEQYLEFEDWQVLGRFYGITARVDSSTYVEFGDAHGFEAHASAILNPSEQIISAAEALCLDDERNWSGKPLYQLRSMAQTRACAKALRNTLAWVVVLAGYKPTPAEEISPEMQGEQQTIKQPARTSSRTNPATAGPTINEAQINTLKETASKCGLSMTDVSALFKRHNWTHAKEIPADQFENVLGELRASAEAN